MSNGTSYQVLALKYRPQTFSELTGQEHISRTLQNAIDSGRVAHAFLFTGARGVGKTSTARILAKTLNCEQGVTHEPCNTCLLCLEITRGISTDVFEIDGASNNGVDDVRELRDSIKYLPSHSRYRIIIIDEVHMLSNSAFNALLKTLEEPPAHVKFIFATTEPHKLPVTILSRCQRFDFRRVQVTSIVGRLRQIADNEQVTISDAALTLIARKGDGSMRDSLTTFDQVLAFCDRTVSDEDVITLIGAVDPRLLAEIASAVFSGDPQRVLAGIKRVDMVGYSMRQFCQDLIEHFRHILVTRSVRNPEEILDLADTEMSELRQLAAGCSAEDIQRRLTLLIKADSDMALASFQRLILEMALLKAATLAPVIPIQELIEKVRQLEHSAVHTPVLPWNAAAAEAPAACPQDQHKPGHRSEPPPPRKPAPETSPPPEGAKLSSHAGWERFVAYALEKRPALGAVLEHGSPLKLEPGLLEIGFPAGSYYLTSAQDADSIREITELDADFRGAAATVRVRPIIPETGDAPQSLVEKKKNDQEQRLEALKREVGENPVISKALELFGGRIVDIREA